MLLKSSIFTFAVFILMLSAGASWPQASGDKPPRSSAPPPAEPQPAHKTPHRELFPDDVAGLEELAEKSYQDGQYLRFVQATIKLRQKRPYAQRYLVNMVIGGALLGRPSTAYNYMHVMQQQGLSYDFNSTEDTRSIRNTEAYDYLNDLLIKAGEPVGEVKVAFSLPATALQPQAIAWDDTRGMFLIGSMEPGRLVAVTPAGAMQELLRTGDDEEPEPIHGIAVDAAHQRLWVTAAGMGRGALLEFDLETLKLRQRYDLPEDGLPHMPGSVAVTPAGDVYLIDQAEPLVFRKPAGDVKLEAYPTGKELAGLKDLALSAAGDKLYLANTDLGIVVLDLANQTSSILSGPDTMNLGGISGLMFSEGNLFMLQNGIQPQRLMRLELDTSGLNVLKIVPLAVAMKEFEAPAFGTIQGGTVYYFAGRNRPAAGKDPVPVVVLKTPVLLREAIVPVEQRKWDADKLKRKPGAGADTEQNLDT